MVKAVIQFTQEFIDEYQSRIVGTIPVEPVVVNLSTPNSNFLYFGENPQLGISHKGTGEGIVNTSLGNDGKLLTYWKVIMVKGED